MASDVFSLGSTLLFAASGHAPYQGETVMDILVQLATEPPDLSGLPPELCDIVACCLDRDPRQRPTPAALVAGLAQYVDTEAPHEFGPASLPDAGRALIEEYRERPQPSARVTDAVGDDATVGSQPAAVPRRLPAPAWPPSRVGRSHSPWLAVRGGAPAAAGWRNGRVGSMVVAIGAVAALVILGGLMGAWLDHGRTQPTQPANAQTTDPGPGRLPPGDPPPPVSGASDRPGDPRGVTVNQPMGDGNTIFVLHGRGWRPGQQVTVALLGRPASRAAPVVDMAGSFNYAVNQQQEFFPGPIPPGLYTAVVTAAGGARAEVGFTVRP
jgi:hypothetical protein